MTKTILQRKNENILKIHEVISNAKKLKPSQKINSSLSELVRIVINTSTNHSKKILLNKDIISIKKSLREISSEAESELELFWVKKILESNNPKRVIEKFPYYSNYQKMTDSEIKSMLDCQTHKNHKILFVGSGPLPLSSIIMAREHNMFIDNLDMDDVACELAEKLIKRIGLSKKINTLKGDVLDINDFSNYETVFIAALVGKDEDEKSKIINHVVSKTIKGTHIIMRSVNNLGTLLYPEVISEHLKNIEFVGKSKSPKGVINNIIIGIKK